MENKFKLIIQTPEKEVFNGEAVSIALTMEGGRAVLMARHASLVGTIRFTSATVVTGGQETTDRYMIRQGVLNFDNDTNTCRVMAYYCELESEVSVEDAKEYLEFIEAELAKGSDLSEFQIDYLENEKIAVSKQLEK
jgi:F0F1-type ATP synthase epsilon subunit